MADLISQGNRDGAPQARREALQVLAALPAGVAPPVTEVLELLSWQAPRRARGREAAHRDALAGAGLLGATALNAVTSYTKLLVRLPGCVSSSKRPEAS